MHILEFLTEITLVIIGIIAGVVGKSIFEKRFAKFTHLHHERAEVVRKLYRHLTKLDLAFVSILKRFQGNEDGPSTKKFAHLVELHNRFNDFYQLNKVFFSADMCTKIDEFAMASKCVCVTIDAFPIDREDVSYKHNNERLKERDAVWEDARKFHENGMREMRNAIEKDFRNLLGVDS